MIVDIMPHLADPLVRSGKLLVEILLKAHFFLQDLVSRLQHCIVCGHPDRGKQRDISDQINGQGHEKVCRFIGQCNVILEENKERYVLTDGKQQKQQPLFSDAQTAVLLLDHPGEHDKDGQHDGVDEQNRRIQHDRMLRIEFPGDRRVPR